MRALLKPFTLIGGDGMSLAINLLGKAHITRNGARVAPFRGRKAWALLAYLLLDGSSLSRQRASELLFENADDPLRALRWNLTELRRGLGDVVATNQDPITLALPSYVVVDARVLTSDNWSKAADLQGIGHDLLEGMDFPSNPLFESWLLNQRRHIRSASQSVLREAVTAGLATGRATRAIDLGQRLVSLDPLDEESQELLIRSYAAAGDRLGAARQLASCRRLFRRELGIAPGTSVEDATRETAAVPNYRAPSNAASVRARLEAGAAALRVGAVDAGLRSLRKAVAEARQGRDKEMVTESLLELGTALAHSGLGTDQESKRVLRSTIKKAEWNGNVRLVSRARQQLAWVDLSLGRIGSAISLLQEDLTDASVTEVGTSYLFLGLCHKEQGRYEEALRHLGKAVSLARSEGDDAALAFALTITGSVDVVHNNFRSSIGPLQEALEVIQHAGLLRLRPLAEALLSEARLGLGDLHEAGTLATAAHAVGLQIHDSAIASYAERSLGLVMAARMEPESAVELLVSATRRPLAARDYVAASVKALESLTEIGVREGHPLAEQWAQELQKRARRMGMPEMIARARVHLDDLGHDRVPAGVH